MLGFLVVDQDLQVIKVSFAVVAPRSSQDLFDIGVLALVLTHRQLSVRDTGIERFCSDSTLE